MAICVVLLASGSAFAGEAGAPAAAGGGDARPVGEYSLYELTLDDAGIEDVGGPVRHPIRLVMHAIDGRFSSGWVDRSGDLPRKTQFACDQMAALVDARNLTLQGGRLRGRVAVMMNSSLYDFSVDATAEGDRFVGLYETAYGGPDGPKPVGGEVTGNGPSATQDDNAVLLYLGNAVEGKLLTLLVEKRPAGYRAVRARAGGTKVGAGRTFAGAYNTYTHPPIRSDLKVEGGTLRGEVEILIRPDSYVPYDWRPRILICNVTADISKGDITGSYTGTMGVARTHCGRASARRIVDEKQALERGRLAAGADYPRWRGPYSNGSAVDFGHKPYGSLHKAPLLWRSEEDIVFNRVAHGKLGVNLHRAYVGPMVAEGRVYVSSTAENGEQLKKNADDYCLCIDAATGMTLWRAVFRGTGMNTGGDKFGGCGHSMPCITHGKVYFMGNTGRVYCLDAKTGECLWRNDTGPSTYHADDERTNCGNLDRSPVVADGVVTFGGWGTLAGFDAETGRHLWVYSGPGSGTTAPLLWQYVDRTSARTNEYIVMHGTCIEPRTKRVLWTVGQDLSSRVTAQAIAVQDGTNYLVLSGHEGKPGLGPQCFRITPDRAELVWGLDFQYAPAGWGAVLIHHGRVYEDTAAGLACVDLRTGEVLDTVEKWGQGGVSSLIAAEGRLFSEFGCRGKGMFMVTGDRDVGQELRRIDKPYRPISYALCVTPSFADGRLFVRGHDGVYCYDLRATNDADTVLTPRPGEVKEEDDGTWKESLPWRAPGEKPAPKEDHCWQVTAQYAEEQAALHKAFLARWQARPIEAAMPSVDVLVKEIGSARLSERDRAAGAIVAAPSAMRDDAVPGLLRVVAEGRFDSMVAALGVLNKIRPANAQCEPILRRALLGAVRAGRAQAAQAMWDTLVAVAPQARDSAARDVAAALSGADSSSAIAACDVLAVSDADPRTTLPAVIEVLRGSDDYAAVAAARAIERIGPAPDAVPILAEKLGRDYWQLKLASLKALRTCREEAGPAIPALRKLVTAAGSDGPLVREVTRTFRGVGPEGFDELLSSLTKGSVEGSEALARLKEMGGSVTPALIAMLRDRDSGKARTAVNALVALGPDAAAGAVPALIDSLGREDLACFAAWALIRLDSDSQDLAAATLVRLAGKGSGERLAKELLGIMGRIARDGGYGEMVRLGMIGALTRMVEDRRPGAGEALAVLGAMGKAAREALPAVSELVGSDSPLAVAAAETADMINGIGRRMPDTVKRR